MKQIMLMIAVFSSLNVCAMTPAPKALLLVVTCSMMADLGICAKPYCVTLEESQPINFRNGKKLEPSKKSAFNNKAVKKSLKKTAKNPSHK